MWLGYLEDYPDYWTQGESIEDLEDHLRDIRKEFVAPPPTSLPAVQ